MEDKSRKKLAKSVNKSYKNSMGMIKNGNSLINNMNKNEEVKKTLVLDEIEQISNLNSDNIFVKI